MHSPENAFSGVWTALATPFLQDEQLDMPSFDQLLELQLEAGVRGVVVGGTTGEGPTLTAQEKLSLVRRARAISSGRFRVMASVGSSNTNQTLEMGRLARDAGADSLLVVTPPYNRPNLAGLKAHFSGIAKAAAIPICLYHVPSRTGQKLTPEELGEICSIPLVQAVKEASGDLGYLARARQVAPLTTFLSGDDFTLLASLAVGAAGAVSVVANVFAKETVALFNAVQSNNLSAARKINDALFAAMEALFLETNPGPLKAALMLRFSSLDVLRLPMTKVTDENRRKITDSFARCTASLKLLNLK